MSKIKLYTNYSIGFENLKLLNFSVDICVGKESFKPLKAECPRDYVKRLAKSIAQDKLCSDNFVVSVAKIVAVGRRILLPAKNKNQACEQMKLLSGNSHRVYSAICLIDKNGKEKTKVIETRVKIRPMSDKFIIDYVECEDNWKDFSGSYNASSIKGMFLIKSITGSYSALQSVPMYELECMI